MKFHSFCNLFSHDWFPRSVSPSLPAFFPFISLVSTGTDISFQLFCCFLKPDVNMEVSFPISQLCSSWRCLTRHNPTSRVGFSPSGLLLPTSWLRKEVLGEAPQIVILSLFCPTCKSEFPFPFILRTTCLVSCCPLVFWSHCLFFPLEPTWVGSTEVVAHWGLSGLLWPGGCWEGRMAWTGL